MKLTDINNIYSLRAGVILFIMLILSGCLTESVALPVEHYAGNSMLSEGRWMKVRVDDDGIFFLSNADLKSMGFNDPAKVKVYGYGGRMEPEALTSSMGDDLPQVPVAYTSRGIYFFGTSHFQWKRFDADMEYTHIQNPYSEQSFYFLSDREVAATDFPLLNAAPAGGGRRVTSFTRRLVHERDLAAPSETGRVLLGEDFRTNTNQTFNFKLPHNIGTDVRVKTQFGAYTTGGSTSLIFTANGKRLPSSADDRILSVNSNQFLRLGTTVKTISDVGESLAFGIECSYSGVMFTARLDFIEVEYECALKLDSELYFYGEFNDNEVIELSGCSENTVIWDVTDPIRPMIADFALEGDKGLLRVAGYHEFIAFEPDKVTSKPSTRQLVANQDIHGLETPDMIIITPHEYKNSAERIAALHRETDGFIVHVLEPEAIYNEFSSGSADVGAFRKMLKMWYDRGLNEGKAPGYCLIIGRPTYDNKMVSAPVASAGFPRVPIWQSDTGFSENLSFSTDDYIAMLDDCEENMFEIGSAFLRIAVGRLPVTSQQEAEAMALKLENYVKKPNYGPWRNNVMLIADDQDMGEHLLQAEEVYNGLRENGNGRHFTYDRLYLDSYPLTYTGTGASYPEAKEKMLRKFNESLFIEYIGHAAATSWSHEGLLTWNDIQNVSNSNHAFLYAATCSFGQWDADNISGGEKLVLNPESGMIGMIVPSRTVYISSNGILSKATAPFVFSRDAEGKGQRFGDIYMRGKNNVGMSDSNKLRYCLIADPAMRLPSPELEVEITSICGKDVTADNEEFPVVAALDTFEVEGRVVNSEGALMSDFNGTVDLRLRDAETVVETYGNGKEGKVMIYNDRKNLLYKGRADVTGGLWKATVMMPSEISNNYSPAQLACYAFDPSSGQEANGSTERFYVYGYPLNESTDTEGPEINNLYLNNSAFTEGSVVNNRPVVYADFRDPSGINLSDSGIGHKMTICIDGTRNLDDVTDYYTPDTSDSGSGSIVYPLPELAPGAHELSLTVWDNANNVSTRSLSFNVGVTNSPGILSLTTDVNPAKTSVIFSVLTDRPMTRLSCEIEVFDLSGRRIWNTVRSASSGVESTISAGWNLTDASGSRVARGIYLYRATVTTPEGTYSTKTKKLAVAAP